MAKSRCSIKPLALKSSSGARDDAIKFFGGRIPVRRRRARAVAADVARLQGAELTPLVAVAERLRETARVGSQVELPSGSAAIATTRAIAS